MSACYFYFLLLVRVWSPTVRAALFVRLPLWLYSHKPRLTNISQYKVKHSFIITRLTNRPSRREWLPNNSTHASTEDDLINKLLRITECGECKRQHANMLIYIKIYHAHHLNLACWHGNIFQLAPNKKFSRGWCECHSFCSYYSFFYRCVTDKTAEPVTGSIWNWIFLTRDHRTYFLGRPQDNFWPHLWG